MQTCGASGRQLHSVRSPRQVNARTAHLLMLALLTPRPEGSSWVLLRKKGSWVALPAGSNGPGRPARAPLPAIARFEQLARRAADPQMLEHSNLRLTRATCVGCHRLPLGAGARRQLLGGRPYRHRRHGLKHATRLAGALGRLAPLLAGPAVSSSGRARGPTIPIHWQVPLEAFVLAPSDDTVTVGSS
jgi:hypothetical protein